MTDVGNSDSQAGSRVEGRVRGWLLVYLVVLVLLAVHGLGLTVAAVVVYADPARAGLTSFIPLGSLVFYVATNAVLIAYTAVLLALMHRRRRAAIVNNIVFNLLSVLFLIVWHFLGAKSQVGMVIDAVPGLVGIAYFLRSKRVRRTFVDSRSSTCVAAGGTAFDPR